MRFAFRGGKTEFLLPDKINLVASILSLIPQICPKVKPGARRLTLSVYNLENHTVEKISAVKISNTREALVLHFMDDNYGDKQDFALHKTRKGRGAVGFFTVGF